MVPASFDKIQIEPGELAIKAVQDDGHEDNLD